MTRTDELHSDGLLIRPYETGDEPAVRRLLEDCLARDPDGPNADLFAWKHRDNAFGRSPVWVALDGRLVVGLRTFMRWRFRLGAHRYDAVRAVDTATHGDYRGRGIFTRLTRHGVAELTRAGTAFIFNTPNDMSRPGYLKLGWQTVGRLPVGVLPRSVRTLPRILRARVPAALWSTPTAVGLSAGDAFADEEALAALLEALPAPAEMVTDRSAAYLRWRYGFWPLHYRAVLVGKTAADGLMLFRLRRRGAALELAVAELLLPARRRGVAVGLIKKALQRTRADYAIGLQGAAPRAALVPLPHQGPQLTARSLATGAPSSLSRWSLSLGDVELF